MTIVWPLLSEQEVNLMYNLDVLGEALNGTKFSRAIPRATRSNLKNGIKRYEESLNKHRKYSFDKIKKNIYRPRLSTISRVEKYLKIIKFESDILICDRKYFIDQYIVEIRNKISLMAPSDEYAELSVSFKSVNSWRDNSLSFCEKYRGFFLLTTVSAFSKKYLRSIMWVGGLTQRGIECTLFTPARDDDVLALYVYTGVMFVTEHNLMCFLERSGSGQDEISIFQFEKNQLPQADGVTGAWELYQVHYPGGDMKQGPRPVMLERIEIRKESEKSEEQIVKCFSSCAEMHNSNQKEHALKDIQKAFGRELGLFGEEELKEKELDRHSLLMFIRFLGGRCRAKAVVNCLLSSERP